MQAVVQQMLPKQSSINASTLIEMMQEREDVRFFTKLDDDLTLSHLFFVVDDDGTS